MLRLVGMSDERKSTPNKAILSKPPGDSFPICSNIEHIFGKRTNLSGGIHAQLGAKGKVGVVYSTAVDGGHDELSARSMR
jgi:hypothetical protein